MKQVNGSVLIMMSFGFMISFSWNAHAKKPAFDPNVCWNFVIQYPDNDPHPWWVNACKGSSAPLETLLCGGPKSEHNIPLTKDEKKQFNAWKRAGRPKSPCQQRDEIMKTSKDFPNGFDPAQCWDHGGPSKVGYEWPNGCRGNSDPRTNSRCTASFESFTEDETVQYKAWVKVGKPETICQKREKL